MEDEEFDTLKTCEELVGHTQCTDPEIACFELEEGGDDNMPLCAHCWIQGSVGRCEKTAKETI